MVTQTVIPDKCATILIHQSSKNWNKWIAMLGRLVVPSSKVSWKFTKLLMKVCIQYVGRVCLGNKLQNVRTWIHTLINILAAAVEEVQKLQTLPQWHSYHQEKRYDDNMMMIYIYIKLEVVVAKMYCCGGDSVPIYPGTTNNQQHWEKKWLN